MKPVLKGTTITIEADDETSAAHVMAALTTRQWIRMSNGGIQIADAQEEPKASDHNRLINGSVVSCFPIPDGKTAAPIQKAACDSDKEKYMPSCYVQHIGAGIRDGDYGRVYNLMISVGFNLLRSPKGPDGKHWEIWYLPGLWSLTGQLKDISKDKDAKEKLVKWLYQKVIPGNVSFDGEAWALTFDD